MNRNKKPSNKEKVFYFVNGLVDSSTSSCGLVLLTESAGCILSHSKQCCYRMFELLKTWHLPKLPPKERFQQLTQLTILDTCHSIISSVYIPVDTLYLQHICISQVSGMHNCQSFMKSELLQQQLVFCELHCCFHAICQLHTRWVQVV